MDELEDKTAFIKRLDGTFEKYESVVRLRYDLEKMQAVLDGLMNSGLEYETILILMQHHTKLPKKTINAVLKGLQEIPRRYFSGE